MLTIKLTYNNLSCSNVGVFVGQMQCLQFLNTTIDTIFIQKLQQSSSCFGGKPILLFYQLAVFYQWQVNTLHAKIMLQNWKPLTNDLISMCASRSIRCMQIIKLIYELEFNQLIDLRKMKVLGEKKDHAINEIKFI